MGVDSAKIYYPNMDIARYIMAIAVLVAHYNILGGHDFYFPLSSFEGVGGFFAISGFLMYPSFIKSKTIVKYIKSRAKRILPPYFFTIIFFAIVLMYISRLEVVEYFTNSGFWKYLIANITFLNWLCPDLPGVFEGSEYYHAAVNGSLWTMKIEWCLYISVPIVIWLINRLKWKKEYMALAIIAFSCIYRFAFITIYNSTGNEIYNILGRQVFGQLSYFYAGMYIYFTKNRFYAFRRYILIFSIVAYLATKSVPYSDIFLAPIFIAAITLAFSMLRHTFNFLQHRNNLSYNIYLLHYPIIQLSIYLGINALPEWISFSLIFCVVVLLSIICTFLIEQPIKRLFIKWES